jgi:hypothetical protein
MCFVVQRRESVMNAAIEFHDSDVTAIELAGDSVVVRLLAYVHRSDGIPGKDAGTGWTQAVEMVFAGGVVEDQPTSLPCGLYDGQVSGGAELDGMVSLPTSIKSTVRFEALTSCSEQLTVRGTGLEVVPVAEGKFIETFPGADHA